MSADKSTSSDSSKPLKRPTPTNDSDDLHGLSKIDWRIKRLKAHLSPSPYLLDLPSDRPYNVQPQQANDWRLTWRQNHPFDRKEKALQYMSFHHLEWEDSLLRPVGNWDDGKGRIMEEDPAKVEGLPSGPGTPLLGASTVKKKISMKDYIGKKSGQQSSTTPSQQQPSHGAARSKEKVEEKVNGLPDIAKTNTSKNPRKEPTQVNGDEKSVPPHTAGKKRPHGSSDDSLHDHSTPKQDTHHPEKKARLGSPIHEAPSKTSPRPKPVDSDMPIPRELSPSLPPNLDEIIPKQISPTLPAALESELKHLPTLPNGTLGHKKSASVNSVLSESKKSKSQDLLDKSFPSPKPKSTTNQLTNETKDVSKATPSPSMKAAKTEKPGPGSGRSHKPSDSDVSQKPVLVNGVKSSSSQEPERSKEAKVEKKKRIIKLKYGRKNRISVKRILGMKPHPKKVFDDIPPRKTKEEESRSQREKLPKVDESKIKSPLPRPEKRPRPAEEDETSQQQKRSKIPSNLNLTDKPRTPVPAPFKSPAFSKSQFSTPKKDLKSVAMRRVDSGDGDARTPSGARSGTPTAPNSVERGTMAKTSPPNTSGNVDGRQEQKRQWRAEAGKYEQLARSLKHEADKHLKIKEGPSANVSEEDAKLGAVTAIETILCYMLSFFATDQAVQISTGKQVTDANSWLTIMKYWYFVRPRIETFPDLHGLCLQIGALCRETICVIDMEKLAQDPLPKNSGDGISPPSDPGNMTPNSAKAEKYHREYVEFKARMVSNFQKARALWVDGMRDLSVQKIKEEYPKTWAMQESDAWKRGKEMFVPGKYEGMFYLPLAATSSSIEAVRFGCALLGEWCKKEGIKWDSKIGL